LPANKSTHDSLVTVIQPGDFTLPDLGVFVLVDLATQQPNAAAQSLADCTAVMYVFIRQSRRKQSKPTQENKHTSKACEACLR